MSSEIIELTWSSDEVEYCVSSMNNIGHQLNDYYIDTEETKCLLFESKEKCEEYYKNVI